MSQRPRVLFRADGNSQIGLGHVMRCLALAEMLTDAFDCRFALIEPESTVKALIQQAGVDVIRLLPSETESTFLAHIEPSDLIVLDGYQFDQDFQNACRERCQTLVYIDDLCQPNPVAQVIINHAGGVTRQVYYGNKPMTDKDAQLLLGTDYALLRRAFLDRASANVPVPTYLGRPERVLVNLGGADPDNVSLRVVDALLNNGQPEHVTLILGSANRHRASFALFEKRGLTILSNLSATDMAAAIQEADVAVVSCSTISYEVATLGKPFVGILTAHNQERLRTFYQENQLALTVLEKAFSADKLLAALTQPVQLIAQSLQQQRRFFDGQSGRRLRAFFDTLSLH